MASATKERATEVVKEAEDTVSSAAKAEEPAQVESIRTDVGQSRAWDSRAQFD